MKKIMSFILVISILMTVLFSLNISAYGEQKTTGVFTFTEYDTYCTLTSCDLSAEGEIIIPSSVDFNGKSLPVTAIGIGAFQNCPNITSVIIPEGVKEIGLNAFRSCENLKNISIPESVISIGYTKIIDRCSNIKYNIFDNAYYLGNEKNPYLILISAVDKTITSCIINEKTVFIQSGAFNNCSDLIDITVPDSVRFIGYNAFYKCNNLNYTKADKGYYLGNDNNPYVVFFSIINKRYTSCNINERTEVIYDSAFSGCTDLKDMTIPDNVKYIGYSAFSDCTNLESITFGKGLTSIGMKVFENCKKLKSVSIPDNITSIGGDTFKGCVGLESVIFGKGLKSISGFEGCTGLTSIIIPDSVTTIESSTFQGCTGLKSITIPDNVQYLGPAAFEDCTVLESIIIGSGVKTLYNRLFFNCISLKNITITGNLIAINDFVFSGCTSLENITMPDSLLSIGYHAFYGCKNLKNIDIPDNVESIGENAFAGCSGCESINVSKNNKKYSSLDNCLIETESKTLVLGCKNSVIPDDGSVIAIGENAFYENTGLCNITIPDSITSIGVNAFKNSGLGSVTIGKGVTVVTGFSGCKYLKNVTMSEGVIEIGDSAFAECDNLINIVLPDSVKSIGNSAFYRCNNLECIVIGTGVVSIGKGFFSTLLKKIPILLYKGTQEQFDNIKLGTYVIDTIKKMRKYYEFNGVVYDGVAYQIHDTYCDALAGCDDQAYIINIVPYIEFNGNKFPVKTISSAAFAQFQNLNNVTLPYTLVKIEKNAFYNSYKIKKSLFLGTEGDWDNVSVDDGNDYVLNTLEFHNEHVYKDIYDTVCDVCGYEREREYFKIVFKNYDGKVISQTDYKKGDTVTVPDDPTRASDYSCNYIFEGWDSPIEVVSEDKVYTAVYKTERFNLVIGGVVYKRDGDSCYVYGNKDVDHDVVIQNSVDWDGEELPVTSIGEQAFFQCFDIYHLYIPENIKKIGENAFYNCHFLESIEVDEGNTNFYSSGNCLIERTSQNLIIGCSNSTIPEGVKTIGENAFIFCHMDSIVIPDGVTSIGSKVFLGCTSLKEITFPKSLNYIGDYAFHSCYKLEKVTIKDCDELKINIRGFNEPLTGAEIVFVKTEPAIEKGDCNGDGTINNKDVVTLFKYVSSGNNNEDANILDFNNDGAINNKDVVALFKYVSSY